MAIGKRIREARRKRGMTQVQLAEAANISRSYLADIEGERYNPSVDTLTSIAVALNTTPSYLTGFVQEVVATDGKDHILSKIYADNFGPTDKKRAPAIHEDDRGLQSEFMKLFSHLSPEQQEVIVAAMRGMRS